MSTAEQVDELSTPVGHRPRRETLTVIDTDVHHNWSNSAELISYLPPDWKDYVHRQGHGASMPILPERGTSYMPHGPFRLDSFPEDGSTPGSDYELMRRQLLERDDTKAVVLTFGVGGQTGMLNPYYALALSRAANDWNLDRWLSLPDDRLRGLILVPTELPEEGANEIRRCAEWPRVSGVLLVANSLAKPIGHPLFDPIFKAASDCELPVVVHVGGEAHMKGVESAGGTSGGMIERYEVLHQPGMHYITSMVTHGLFERFPSLKVMFLEFGFLWLPPLLWRMDALRDVLLKESPLVKRLPSEYISDHVRFSIQPLDYVPEGKIGIDAVSACPELRQILCYSSDYPHWDADEPKYVASRFPREWRDDIFYRNAKQFFGDRI